MEQVLRIPVVRIGTSRGIRIPKKVLDACQIHEEVVAYVTDDSITLKPTHKPRQGWEEDFKRAHAEGADRALIPNDLDTHLWDRLDD